MRGHPSNRVPLMIVVFSCSVNNKEGFQIPVFFVLFGYDLLTLNRAPFVYPVVVWLVRYRKREKENKTKRLKMVKPK